MYAEKPAIISIFIYTLQILIDFSTWGSWDIGLLIFGDVMVTLSMGEPMNTELKQNVPSSLQHNTEFIIIVIS